MGGKQQQREGVPCGVFHPNYKAWNWKYHPGGRELRSPQKPRLDTIHGGSMEGLTAVVTRHRDGRETGCALGTEVCVPPKSWVSHIFPSGTAMTFLTPEMLYLISFLLNSTFKSWSWEDLSLPDIEGRTLWGDHINMHVCVAVTSEKTCKNEFARKKTWKSNPACFTNDQLKDVH